MDQKTQQDYFAGQIVSNQIAIETIIKLLTGKGQISTEEFKKAFDEEVQRRLEVAKRAREQGGQK